MQMSDRVVCRNFDALAKANALPEVDNRITFDEEKHVYHVDGKKVPQSVTRVLKDVFKESEFNPDAVISKNLASWKRKPESKHKTVSEPFHFCSFLH